MTRTIRWGSIALPLAVAATLPTGASAATAPTKFIGLTPSGEQAIYPELIGIAPGATGELLNVPPSRNSLSPAEAAIVNTATSTSTPLLPGNAAAYGASADLKRVLFATTAVLDPADTNATDDLYVYDRTTGTSTLVSRAPSGGALGSATGVIAPDGKSVSYTGSTTAATGTYRYDLPSGTVAQVMTAPLTDYQHQDTAGKVVAGYDGFSVGTTYKAYPAGANIPSAAHFTTSPDGSAIAAKSDLAGLQIINTATGAVRTVSVPSSLTTYGYGVIQTANGGGTVVVGSSRGTGSALVAFVARLDTTTGTITQIGGDIPNANGSSVPGMATADLAFAASSTTLSQLGTTPIPGGGTTGAPVINPTEYTFFRPGCSSGGFFSPAVAATFQLVGAPKGTDPRVPTSAVMTVYGATGSIVNQFTIKADARRSITPTAGGFTYSAAVTFNDGTSRTGTGTIAPYTPIKNTGTTISNFFDPSACYSANR